MIQEEWTIEEFKEYLSGAKTNKYGAEKTTVDGIKFDSKMEAERWCELKILERAGEIHDLSRQPKFTLLEGCTRYGDDIRPITYSGDFMYSVDGQPIVEDVKGSKMAVSHLFRDKWKLVRYQNPGIKFVIVEMGR